MTIDTDYLVRTLQDLVRINSVNPTLVAGAPGEDEIAQYVAGELARMGLEVSTHEPHPGRKSVVGVLRGRGGGRSLMLNGHLDTVSIDGMPQPLSGDIRSGKLYGRGSYDMKGGVAACMAAVKALADARKELAGDVVLAAVADEEHSSIGTADVVAHHKVDGAIVAEPTELQICVAHKGFIWYEIETVGRAAHGSRFDLGIDANLHMGRLLEPLEKLLHDLYKRKRHPLLGPASFHAATLHGGTGPSTYAGRCALHLERRTIPGETEREVTAELQAILDDLQRADERFRATLKTLLVRTPFEVATDTPVVTALTRAATRVLGSAPAYSGQSVWMDASLLADAGIDTVVMGAAGAGAHADEEWVDVQSARQLAETFAQTAVDYCGAPA